MLASAYDDIAGMYHAFWSEAYLPGALPALEGLFFSRVPPKARILDVCCGSGHISGELVARGYRVTGVDSSAALIAIARKNLPKTEFYVQDVRHLKDVGHDFPAALSTFDSLNHILTLEDLHTVFVAVRQTLMRGGLFVFDMNLHEAYSMDMRQWSVNIRDTTVALSRGVYDSPTRTAQTELIWFQREPGQDCWRQQRSVVLERCYPKDDIVRALEFAGFKQVETFHSVDLGVNPELGFGRYFFSATAA